MTPIAARPTATVARAAMSCTKRCSEACLSSCVFMAAIVAIGGQATAAPRQRFGQGTDVLGDLEPLGQASAAAARTMLTWLAFCSQRTTQGFASRSHAR